MGGKPQECETGRVGVLQQARGFLLLTGVWLTLGRLELGGWGHSQDLSGPKRPKITSPHLPAPLKPQGTGLTPPVCQGFRQWVCRGGFPKTAPSLEDSLVSGLPHCTPPPPQPSPAQSG